MFFETAVATMLKSQTVEIPTKDYGYSIRCINTANSETSVSADNGYNILDIIGTSPSISSMTIEEIIQAGIQQIKTLSFLEADNNADLIADHYFTKRQKLVKKKIIYKNPKE